MEIKYFSLGSLAANCYLVKTEDAAIIIDPFKCDTRIEEFLNENSSVSRIILLTHCHFDHVLGVNEIREKFGIKAAIGEKDAEGLENSRINLSVFLGRDESIKADILLSDGEVFCVGNTKIEVIHTPGHTLGSVCYKIEDALFTGDILFKNSIGRTDFPTGSHSQMAESLTLLKNLGANDIKIYAGHGEPTTMREEIKHNPYL